MWSSLPLLLLLPLAAPTAAAATKAATRAPRSVSWWFSIGENTTTDAANMAYLSALPAEAVTRVMPDMGCVKGDAGEIFDGKPWPATGVGILYGDAYAWWGVEQQVQTWLPALRKAVPRAKICPWILDTSNATLFHEKVLPNATAFIADAISIAKHFGFDGWHIDYEDERPADSYPHKHDDLRRFLAQFSAALHAEGLELVIDVAGWSNLLSNYSSIAASGVDQLQNMAFYDRPGTNELATYFDQVKVSWRNSSNPTGWSTQAGVGIGVYYDGRNGYPDRWTEDEAKTFFAEIVKQGGNAVDIFRLCKNTVDDWPRADWWKTLISDFATGKL